MPPECLETPGTLMCRVLGDLIASTDEYLQKVSEAENLIRTP